jgi:hypothetical protein
LVCPFVEFAFRLLDDHFTPAHRKRRAKASGLKIALRMFNFGIHLWPWVTLVTLLKRGNGSYLAWRDQFWGRKRP